MIVTRHAPSAKSNPAVYVRDPASATFESELEPLILNEGWLLNDLLADSPPVAADSAHNTVRCGLPWRGRRPGLGGETA